MYIKEVCLDGFKSYATRTVIRGFDPLFNAITGLNGTGKSNILDSICFVLGIKNLSQVRVSNLQELVYKHGQAGITKATVSVVFDNSDRSRSPIGYEDCREITVTREIVAGGRQKYLINGRRAESDQVKNLFQSVQLNVDNPHFLIMQGRITKVLNMKPIETLSMLEEAAGTRMYERKKDIALKTLVKKQGKVDMINRLLDNEILPVLEKLRKERTEYMQWSNANAELDRLKRFCIAYEFVEAEKIQDNAVRVVDEIRLKICEIDTDTKTMQTEVKEMEEHVSRLTLEKDANMGGEVKRLSDRVDAIARDLNKEVSRLENEEEDLSSKKINVEEIQKKIEDKASAIKNAEDGADDLKTKIDELAKSLEGHEKEYEDGDKSLLNQLGDAELVVTKAEADLKQLKTKISRCETELKEKTAKLLSKHDEAVALENEVKVRQKDVENVERALTSLSYQEGLMESLKKDWEVESQAVNRIKENIQCIYSCLGNLKFSYHDLVKKFDRSKVKGLVGELTKVKNNSTMTALEICAGGKLFYIVVDNDITAQQIIENRDLRGRVTTIPLNRIKSKPVQLQVQEAAVELVGKGNAEVALSLVGYADEVKIAMEFVFGDTFVCKTYDAGDKVAFDPLVKTRSVTLEGDVFQPGGLVTGGSARHVGDQLRQLHALGEAYSELFLHEKRLSEIEAKINALVPLHDKYNELKHQLEVKTFRLKQSQSTVEQNEHHKINALVPLHDKYNELKHQLEVKTFRLKQSQSTVEQNEHHKLSEIVKRINQELEEAKSALIEKQAFYKECVTKVANLENSVQDHASNEDGSLKTREEKIKAVKKKMQSAKKNLKGYEKEREKLIMKVEALKQEHASLENQLVSLQNEISMLTSEVDVLKTKVSSLKDEHSQAQSEFNSANTKLVECDSQIGCIRKEQEKLKDRIREKVFERKRLESEVKRTEVEQKNCSLKVDKLISKHAWITSEKQFFGRSGSDYDFTSRDPHRARDQLENLEAQQADHAKRVNKKVMSMFERTEDEYNDLISKKNIIETDKSKIKLVIEEVDAKKKEILQATWVKVNSNFGSIFSTLLPGTMAKLEPPEGGTCFDGLEVRVALGGVWKQSLSELSGGQRSLLALSLILALLLFKPAPIYILDEVDAALDLSHTQNIGRMIKTHFPHSQFIVVSLKEGLFNNANVLFRTKFVDGVSTVQRTVATNQRK
ncbi:RecF/RecN/SMC [Artemisia annua]|uniref:Structural maintenance of chromosomes protein n=1 Tax=Artemisia annua TaxID=35608 RepID=A0A2U1N1R5_ARTAN|nr:RecF/RecN/SMC [Artemisia annua]